MAKMRYLAIWFPFLPTDRLAQAKRSNSAARGSAPLAVIERQHGSLRLTACDPLAASLGLTRGMTLADARARVPELCIEYADPARDICWLEQIADACERFTPRVMTEPPDGLVLDITGCAHLFGDELGLSAEIERRMRHWTGHLRHAIADTSEGARALARFLSVSVADEKAALRQLPVAALELDYGTENALRRAGLKLVGDLADRPSGPLTARFGTELTSLLDRLLGRSDSRITPRRTQTELTVEQHFSEPIIHTDGALGVIENLAKDVCGTLEIRLHGGRSFVARLFRCDGHVIDLCVDCSQPLRDPVRIMRLFAERIGALADPINPGYGFDMICLSVPQTEPLAASQLALEGSSAHSETLAALIDRLSVRVGRARIKRFAARDTHIPERAIQVMNAIEVSKLGAWPAPNPGEPPHRPIHLFDPPQSIEVIAEVPDGPPRRFRWRRNLHEVTRCEGPERIATEWWRRAPGDPGLTRDYYRVEDSQGKRFWLFRHGLYNEKPSPGWYVHGLFA